MRRRARLKSCAYTGEGNEVSCPYGTKMGKGKDGKKKDAALKGRRYGKEKSRARKSRAQPPLG